MNARDFLFQLKWDPFFQDQLQDIRIIGTQSGGESWAESYPLFNIKGN